jgi:Na+/H+-dicarboxylate symporter/ABC-type amino acid transport substrate-binding protein
MKRRIHSMTLASKVLIGFIVGIASGVFFGELIAPVGIVGDAFIRLLQMTVLPYVLVSLILGLGRLSSNEAGRLFKRAGALLLVLWAVALVFVLVMPLAYPNWESGSYFSTSLVEPTPELGLVNLFIPANPFSSLASGTVPAVVLFSLALGAALIGIENKQPIIDALDVISTALSRVAKFVVQLAPLGVFAITARAAGTLDFGEMQALEVYLATYLIFWLALGLWFLPMLTASLLPLKYREVMGPARDALVTAFATGSVFVVLPILAEHSKDLVRRCAPESEDAHSAVDVLIPLGFTFPGPGTLLILGFIPFAAWVAGVPITTAQQPGFLSSGLMSLFGSTMVAVPFLLDQLRIPADLFQLYVVSDVFTGRFGMLISGIFILNWSTVGACALTGAVRVRMRSLIKLALGTIVIVMLGLFGVRMIFTYAVSHDYQTGQQFMDRELLLSSAPATQLNTKDLQPAEETSVSTLDRIRSRGAIRVGYRADELPFSFENSSGQLVGHDIDLAHLLAADLGVRLELVAITRSQTAELLADGSVDVGMSGVVVTPQRAISMEFTDPYLDETLAFVVRDHRRHEFSTRESVVSRKGLRVAVPDLPGLAERVADYLDDAEIVVLDSHREFFTDENDSYDALVFSAEAGSTWTLLYPEFCVAIPQPDVFRVPVAFPVAPGDERMRTFLNTWIDLKRRNNTLQRIYDYWILGKSDDRVTPRWSVIRDVLHWVD